MAKRRTRAEVDRNRKLVLKVLDGTFEGEVLKALMENPLGETIGSLVHSTSAKSRSPVQTAVKSLLRRRLIREVKDEPVRYGRSGKGYKFGSLYFLELEY